MGRLAGAMGRALKSGGLGARVGWCVVVAVLLLAPATVISQAQGSAEPIRPLVLGWEQFFKLDWEPTERRGQPAVRGHIKNDWGVPATDIRLLVDGFDAGGRLVNQDIGWLGSQLPPGIQSYFEVPVRQRAATYKVSVFAFSWIQTGNGADNR